MFPFSDHSSDVHVHFVIDFLRGKVSVVNRVSAVTQSSMLNE